MFTKPKSIERYVSSRTKSISFDSDNRNDRLQQQSSSSSASSASASSSTVSSSNLNRKNFPRGSYKSYKNFLNQYSIDKNLDDQENLVERSNVCEKAQHHHHSTNSKLTDPIQNGTSKIATKQNNGNNDDLQRILSMTNQQFEMLDKEILDRFLKMVIEANNLNDKFSRYDHNNNVVGDDNNHRTISFNNSAANLKNFTFKSNTGDGYKASKITDEEIDESKQKLIDSLKQQLQRYNQKC
ncbi:hypothetical protein SSS_01689 [Sarcoptes scabiei]|uniref:Uncharacterized protein n=1 Tax=Sarcoptes scabiei TaxID=52283 RepID=A0A834RAE9_SARSC|nr:hypothetical protein SSS_01689 [Sarcoptes scabiei]